MQSSKCDWGGNKHNLPELYVLEETPLVEERSKIISGAIDNDRASRYWYQTYALSIPPLLDASSNTCTSFISTHYNPRPVNQAICTYQHSPTDHTALTTMIQRSKLQTSQSTSGSTSYGYAGYDTTTASRPGTCRNTGRPSTARPRTGASTIARVENQHVVCAVTESRGISPTVGLAFVNLDTAEAVLCQICDSQTFVRTVHKLRVYGPSEILIVSTAASPKSKLFSIIEETLEDIGSKLTLLDRRYWAESTGYEYIQTLAFKEDAEAIQISVAGNYYAICCIAAVSSSVRF